MLTLPRTLFGVALVTLLTVPLAAQGTWVRHQPPCRLDTGNPLIRGALLYLKQAVETRFPDQREGRLAEARRVLTEALTGRASGEAAAWYYLGRYYTEMSDGAGADSAFRKAEELEASCTSDIAQYRARLAPLALNEALRTWGAGHPDSAIQFFHQALSLTPDDAEVPLYMGIMYASIKELDSAAKYVEMGLETAETDTAHDARRKQAMVELARALETRAYENQAIIRGPQARVERDSLAGAVERDSTRFSAMVGRVQEIRDRGRQLDPESQRAFEQESTAVATRIAGYVTRRDSLAAVAEADSVAATEALGPAINRYETYLEAYPDDISAGISLARMYSAAGSREALIALIDRIVTAEEVNPSALVQGGMSLYGEGQHASAVKLFERALESNGYDRNALLMLCRAYYALQEGEKLQATAQRLVQVDPLNSNSVRMIALGWVLAGNRDSVDHYIGLAEGGIGWHVNVQQFMGRENMTRLSGSVRNLSQEPLPAMSLVFEFLDAEGNVLFSAPVELPAIDARGRAPLSVRDDRGGAAAWRYRRQ